MIIKLMFGVWEYFFMSFCMVTLLGQPPFSGCSVKEMKKKIQNSVIKLKTNISPKTKKLLLSLLCKNPLKRITLDLFSDKI